MALILGLTLIFAGLILAMGILNSIPALGKHLEKLAKWLGRFQTIIGIVAIIVAILWWGDLLYSIFALISGLVLLTGILPSIPAVGKYLEKLAKWLGRFQTIIGIVAIIVAIFWWGSLLGSIVAIIAGLVLLTGILPSIPALGKHLEKLAKWLGRFQTIIGVVAIIVGILEIL